METSIQVTQNDDWSIVSIVGPINEDAEIHLDSLAEGLGNNILINFRQVSFINSLGVRAWIHFIRKIEGRKIIFEECTSEIVNQINMIPNFKANAEVKSVYGAFYCNDCGTTESFLFEAGKNLPTTDAFDLPELKCKKCQSDDMEFEEVEDAFFAFSIAS